MIVDLAGGNVDYALKAAKGLLTNGGGYAGKLVTDANIGSSLPINSPTARFF